VGALFFREHHFTGSALKPSVYLDDREIGGLANGYWFSVEVKPGRHELGSSAKNELLLYPLKVVPTEHYFLERAVLRALARAIAWLLVRSEQIALP
jgi:hypothetical protein